MPIVVGETLGAYRIIEQLGQGGMATVFKAYHAALDRYVAIKALHPAFKEDKNFLGRFQREARVVARLDHPNIVPIYDFSEHEGRPYLVMKYIEGETLKARLVQKKLSFGEIMSIVDAVGKALTYAHRQGILHRDVKPSNVLLAKDGQIYLADFGLARIASAGESTLSSDMMLGTPQYISPEQAMGKRELDEGTDIYSFGVLLYELLVGKVPFSADTPYAIIHDHIYSPLPLPHSINPKITDDMERVLLKALAKERADRYSTVNELVEAFKNACGGFEESALPIETVETQVSAIPAVLTDTKIPPAAGLESGIHEPTVQGTVSEGETVPPKAERPPSIPVSEEEPAWTPTKTSLPEPVLARKPLHKRWYVWLLVIAGIFGICLFAIIVRGMIKNKQAGVEQAISTATQMPQEIPLPLDLLQQARRNVDENPNDPIVHLDLAVLLIDARQFEDVTKELNRVEGLMGDPGFYIEHGRMYRDQQKWIAAAWAFLRARELNPDWKTGEAIDLWHEAVYKAFMDPEAGRVVDLERIRAVDGPMAGVARVQAELTAGNVGRAETIILEVIKQFENLPEALLVQARVFARLKNTERVVKILDALKQIETLPPWIRDEIGRIEAVEKPKP
jgi:serine/threonine protein kinase